MLMNPHILESPKFIKTTIFLKHLPIFFKFVGFKILFLTILLKMWVTLIFWKYVSDRGQGGCAFGLIGPSKAASKTSILNLVIFY